MLGLKGLQTMAEDQNTITLKTRQFGTLTIDKSIVIRFPKGILGFEDSRRYVVIDVKESYPFQWLLSLDEAEVGFPIISSVFISPEYVLTEEDWETSGLQPIPPGDLATYLVVSLGHDLMDSTVNLKAPAVIDTRRKTGYQIVLDSQSYAICTSLFDTAVSAVG